MNFPGPTPELETSTSRTTASEERQSLSLDQELSLYLIRDEITSSNDSFEYDRTTLFV
jgi:hypothetical protein